MPLLDNSPNYKCDACGSIHVAMQGGCGVYARPSWSESATLCPACVLASERIEMAKRHEKRETYGAYVSSDGARIAIWTGESLAEIIDRHPTNRRGWAGHTSDYILARDAAGRLWYGYGDSGLAIALRPRKGA